VAANDFAGRMFAVAGKVCAVTGGGGVLCGAMARALGEAGARVAVLGRHIGNTEEVASAIRAGGGDALAVACDVLDRGSAEAACSRVLEAFGTVDVLVNGAGGANPQASTGKEFLEPGDLEKGVRSVLDIPLDAFRSTTDLNFAGAFIPTQVFLRPMIEKKAGCIVNISSMGAVRPLTKSIAYSAGKAATDNLTKWLAVYLAKMGIRVNAISPGFFLTKQNRFLLTDEKTGEMTPRGQRILNGTPLGRFGRPEDLISTLLWLVSDASAFVTGAIIPVDGGFSAYGGV
jgi:NAD(P)-dependent dehydrogenase (short-subunit alcohol dehydrogenase family)